MPHLLQRLAQDGEIEGLIGKAFQPLVEVGVHDRNAAVHRADDLPAIELEPLNRRPVRVAQLG